MEGQSKREGATGGGGAGKGRGDIGNIENNFGGEERNAPSEIDGWMALVPRFMVDQEFPVRCTRFFRLRSTSSCPALLLLLFCLFLDFLFVSPAPAPDVVARFCLIYLATCRLATATRCNCGEARVRRRKMSLGCIHNMPEP